MRLKLGVMSRGHYICLTEVHGNNEQYFRRDGGWYNNSPTYFDTEDEAIQSLLESLKPAILFSQLKDGDAFELDNYIYSKIPGVWVNGYYYNCVETKSMTLRSCDENTKVGKT